MQWSRRITYIWANGETRESLFLIIDFCTADSAVFLKWKKGLMENSLLYIKNQICENFIKENQNNFPFLVLNTEPNTLY